jgi:3-(3-hydroxy-phenyl)propionate hydroxylase
MPATYTNPRYAWHPPSAAAQRATVVVAGAGLVGLTLALDLAQRGHAVVVLDEDDTVSFGSRAICFAKRTLEIFGRLGLGRKFLDKGVTWKTGRVFHGAAEAYAFDLLPDDGHEYPAFVNLQQYYAEQWLVEACAATGRVDIRWRHRITSVAPHSDGVLLTVQTPGGDYTLDAAWLLACDGARSTVRAALSLPFEGQVFNDRFLIADVVMRADFPAERWFWFDPPFHPGQSVLLHKQPDDVWRIDFQLGADADPEAEKDPARVAARVRAMLEGATGKPAPDFALEWVSVYTFRCRRIARFRHGRVIFAGDSAHQVSPFGARGANTGVQDADNLAWKLALVLGDAAPEALIDSYHAERAFAADDNLLNSTRSTDFITPKSRTSRLLRDAVLELAEDQPFARGLVNSGRLSTPTPYPRSSLNTPDEAHFAGAMRPGTVCADAPVLVDGRRGWLLEQLGDGFTLLAFGRRPAVDAVRVGDVVARVLHVGSDLIELGGVLSERYDGRPGTTYLIRPDQHVAARWRGFDSADIEPAIARAIGRAE